MFDTLKLFRKLYGPSVEAAPLRRRPPPPTIKPRLEPLEDRFLLTGSFVFQGLDFGNGQNPGNNNNWSNPLNWWQNGVQQTTYYPGKAGAGDGADFTDAKSGNCILDAGVVNNMQINNLLMAQWGTGNTLTVNKAFSVVGPGGAFSLDGGNTLTLNANLTLQDFGTGGSGTFGNGTINGNGGTLTVQGCTLNLTGKTSELDVMMIINGDSTGNGVVNLGTQMGGNLVLNGTNNYIDVSKNSTNGNQGQLNLQAHIALPAQVDNIGGITLGKNHTGNSLAVTIETKGVMERSDTSGPAYGAKDSVQIGGWVSNVGGSFIIDKGSPTNGFLGVDITGNNGPTNGNYAYNQLYDSVNCVLTINQFAQLNCTTGGIDIEAGTLQAHTLLGSRPTTPNIIGNVTFGNTNPTYFTYTDTTQGDTNQVGWFYIRGNVTLAANTTSNMNVQTNGQDADLLLVDGNLVLAGTLDITDLPKTQPPTGSDPFFFETVTNTETITGTFSAMTDQFGDTLANGKLILHIGPYTYSGGQGTAADIKWNY